MRTLVLVTILGLVSSPSHADDREAYTCKELGAKSLITVEFTPETSLKELATWLMGFTCKNVVIDAEAMHYGAKVTILAPRPMTPKAALALFVDAVETTGLVVQVKKDSILVKLGKNTPPRSCVADASSSGLAPAITSAAPPDPEAIEMDAAIAAGIKQLGDTSYEVKKELVDKVLSNPMALAKGARIVPTMKDGKPEGFKLYAIRPSSAYAKLGLINGDTLLSINGHDLTSADKALEIYTSLREAKKLEVKISRRAKVITLTYTIK